MAKTVTILFDGVEKECLVQVDNNGEFVCTARDGDFIKFPASPEGEDADKHLADMVKDHNAEPSNVTTPVSGEAADAKKQELDEWLTPEAKAKRSSPPEPAPSVEEAAGKPTTIPKGT